MSKGRTFYRVREWNKAYDEFFDGEGSGWIYHTNMIEEMSEAVFRAKMLWQNSYNIPPHNPVEVSIDKYVLDSKSKLLYWGPEDWDWKNFEINWNSL